MQFLIYSEYYFTMTRVAIIIPTMNRPDFILRQLEFYELIRSPHPIYLSDSSNSENAEKLKNGIEKFKNFEIIYQWALPGKDNLNLLLPLVKEKYCIQMGDDDIMIPQTISECADFLEDNPDYATCGGKQINFSFRDEEYNQPYGIIGHQTLPHGRSLENDDMLPRIKEFWFNLKTTGSDFYISNISFICFTVRSVELEKLIRNLTKHFSLTEHIMEFIATSSLVVAGKSKILGKLGYVMQQNNNRYSFTHHLTVDVVTDPLMSSKWEIAHKGFAKIVEKMGKTEEESLRIAKWIFIVYLARQFFLEISWPPVDVKKSAQKVTPKSLPKKLRRFISASSFIKNIYYKFNQPKDVSRSESKYYEDFRMVKEFLEK